MKTLAKLLRLRNAIKELQQISWATSLMEKRYYIDDLSETEAKEIIDAYLSFIPNVEKVLSELKDELNEEKNPTN